MLADRDATDARGAPGDMAEPDSVDRGSSSRLTIMALVAMFVVSAGLRWATLSTWLASDVCYYKPDSGGYLHLAYQLAVGDFSFDLIREAPHRTILLSVLLAPIFALFGPGLMPAKLVNAAFGAAAVFPMYAVGKERFGRRAGLWSAGLTVWLHFYFRHSLVLYTEALYVPLYMTTVWLLARALRGKGPFWLVGLVSGLSYLARASGLLAAAAIGAVLLVHALARRPCVRWRDIGVFVSVFAAASSPLWLVKVSVGHTPWENGQNAACLWADTFHQLHQDPERYTLRRWWATHDVATEAPRRLWRGIKACLWIRTPGGKPPEDTTADGRVADEYGFVPHVLGLVGLAWSLRRRRTWFLAGLFALQAAPLCWATVSNPAERLVWGPLGPILTLWMGYAVAEIWQGAQERSIWSAVLAMSTWALLLASDGREFVEGPTEWIGTGVALFAVYLARVIDPWRRGRWPMVLVPLVGVIVFLVYRQMFWADSHHWYRPQQIWLATSGMAIAGGLCLGWVRQRLDRLRIAPLAAAVFIWIVSSAMIAEATRMNRRKIEQYGSAAHAGQHRADRLVKSHPAYRPAATQSSP